MCTADDCWLWARWMTMEYMCALVCNTFFSFSFKQYRFSGLSWRISVEEKKINTLRCSKDFEDLQQCWWTKSLMKIVESSVLFGQEVKILCSQSVLYILPFSRRNSTRIAFFVWATLHLPSVYYYTTARSLRSQAFSQWGFDGGFSPEFRVSDMPSRWFDFRLMNYKHALFQGWWLVSTVGVSLSSTGVILMVLPWAIAMASRVYPSDLPSFVYLRFHRFGLSFMYMCSNFNSFCRLLEFG
jgi:hypothetical protein